MSNVTRSEDVMKTVGIRELRTRLSELVGKAQAGEQIIITDRGREVAALGPITPARRAMIALRRAGKVTWSGGKPSGLRGYTIRGKPLSKTVIEYRR